MPGPWEHGSLRIVMYQGAKQHCLHHRMGDQYIVLYKRIKKKCRTNRERPEGYEKIAEKTGG